MVLSIFTLENNKLTYNYENRTNLTNKVIIETITNSKILIFIDDLNAFLNKKKLRYFTDEKLNLERTSFIGWDEIIVGKFLGFNKIISNLPDTIKYIKLPDRFNGNISSLSSTITHIIFGKNFDSNIDCLPEQIEYLYLGEKFSKPVENVSCCLKKLIFDTNSDFNHNLDNLPNFLEYLILPWNYSQPLDNLPNFLVYLELPNKYTYCLNNLSDSIEKIIFYSCDKIKKIINNKFTVPTVPKYISDLSTYLDKSQHIDKIFVKLPKNLKLLDLTYFEKLNLYSELLELNTNNLNSQYKKEIINQNLPLNNLPKNLRVIKFPSNYTQIQIEKIPQNIVKIWLSNTFNSSVDKLLNCNFGTNKPRPPTFITHLVFGDEFSQSVCHLPKTLTHLYFGKKFNKSVDMLPESIIFIHFGHQFNKSIDNLPWNITGIEFGFEFTHSLDRLKKNILTIKFIGIHRPIRIFKKVLDKNSSHVGYESEYDYNLIGKFDKKVNLLPKTLQKIYIPQKITNCCKEQELCFNKFYSNFENYKDLIEYY